MRLDITKLNEHDGDILNVIDWLRANLSDNELNPKQDLENNKLHGPGWVIEFEANPDWWCRYGSVSRCRVYLDIEDAVSAIQFKLEML